MASVDNINITDLVIDKWRTILGACLSLNRQRTVTRHRLPTPKSWGPATPHKHSRRRHQSIRNLCSSTVVQKVWKWTRSQIARGLMSPRLSRSFLRRNPPRPRTRPPSQLRERRYPSLAVPPINTLAAVVVTVASLRTRSQVADLSPPKSG